MKMSPSIIKIAPALLAAQKKMGAAKKDATNPFFHSTYADLGSVMEVCKEPLNEQGIVILQPLESDEHGVYVETVLLHESGEWMSAGLRIAPKSETNPQDQGSAISYARRYGLQSFGFIPAEDDDAEKSTSHSQASKPINMATEMGKDFDRSYDEKEPMTVEQFENRDECEKCGSAMGISQKGNKYCLAKCWLK